MVTREVAELFRVTSATVIRWAEKGWITCSRTVGGHLRFQRAEVEALARSAGIVVDVPPESASPPASPQPPSPDPPPSTGAWPVSSPPRQR
jgi:excisionase family DNA binding protein